MYNSAGQLLGSWANREDVGLSLIDIGGHEVWAQCDVDAVSYLGVVEPPAIRFKSEISNACLEPFVLVETYAPLSQRSERFYGGSVHGWVGDQKQVSPTNDGHLFVVDTVTPEVFGGAMYMLDPVKKDCVPAGSTPQSDVHILRDVGLMPDLSPPFTLVQQ